MSPGECRLFLLVSVVGDRVASRVRQACAAFPGRPAGRFTAPPSRTILLPGPRQPYIAATVINYKPIIAPQPLEGKCFLQLSWLICESPPFIQPIFLVSYNYVICDSTLFDHSSLASSAEMAVRTTSRKTFGAVVPGSPADSWATESRPASGSSLWPPT